MKKKFLTAEWRKLILANYKVDPGLLKKYVPANTSLDLWKGDCFLSLVGLLFENTRLKGIKFPFHVRFEEVNLRFYVKHQHEGQWRKGIVFIKEIVPRSVVAILANAIYKEHYEKLKMSHFWNINPDNQVIQYQWKKRDWHTFTVTGGTRPMEISTDSQIEFITERYWGYTRINGKKSAEYRVEHPRWQQYEVKDFKLDVDFEKVYGPAFSFLNQQQPASVYLVEGSEIMVRESRRF